MQRSLIWSLLLLPVLAIADGNMVILPQSNGTLKLISEGGAGSEAGWLSQLQPAGKALTVQITPAGPARCENNALTVSPLKIAWQIKPEKFLVLCGEPVRLEAPSQERWVRVQALPSLKSFPASLAQQALSSRVQIGSISFVIESHAPALYPLYLDFSDLQRQAPTLSATFDKSTAFFGLVGDRQDTTITAGLRITKTAFAGSEPLPYRLTFESHQQRNNQWHLRSQKEGSSLPYQIRIADKVIAPDSEHHGTLPSGSTSSDLINIEFVLAGKQATRLPAGTRLLDTLTAVITPDS